MDIIVCPICGSVLYPDDIVYKDAENEYIGCQNCVSEREAIELTFENYDWKLISNFEIKSEFWKGVLKNVLLWRMW